MNAGARLGMAGAVLLALLVATALLAPVLAPFDPSAQVGLPLQPPGDGHLFGTDDIGQDLFSQLLVGARISLFVGTLGALLAIGIGVSVGLSSGFAGGAVDVMLMRLVDVALTIPMLPLMIVLHAWFGSGLEAQILVIGGVMWARTARVLRAQVLSSRERGSVNAAWVMGAGAGHLLRLHMLPAVFPLVIPEFVRAVNAAIMLETSLSFLGFGDPTAKSWGTILFYAHARNAYLTSAWLWWIVPPGIAVTATVFAFAAVGYALEHTARPAMSGLRRHESIPATSHEPAAANRVVEARDVSIGYRTPHGVVGAVEGVSLAIEDGEIVGLVGESGSGKTTLAGALLQLERPPGIVTGGRLLVNGLDVTRLDAVALQRLRGAVVALAPQSAMNALNPVRTIADQLIEAVLAHHAVPRDEARRRAHEVLIAVGVPPARAGAYPHEFSGGMRQRVVVAMALINRPRLLIADEPTTGLDVLRQQELLELLRTLRTRFATAMLFISHDVAAVASLADRLVVMKDGTIVEAGRVRAVVDSPAHPYTRALLASVPRHGAPSSGRASEPAIAAQGAPLLAVTDLRKTFGARWGAAVVPAVDGVTFTMRPGEILGLVGASGAGKSTLARLVVGLEQPDSGQITLAGGPVRRASRADRLALGRAVHLILQDPYDALPPHLRVRSIVAEPAWIHGTAGCLPAGEALEAVGLVPARFLNRFPHTLSGGERQRVALARALVLRPRLIVADEPTSLLDVSRRRELLDVMREVGRRYGTGYLYVTHDLGLAWSFCERLLVMQEGRIVEEGPVDELLQSPRHAYTARLVRAAESLSLSVHPAGAPPRAAV